jgi:hypothetical protein
MSIPTDRGFVRIGVPDETGRFSVTVYTSLPNAGIVRPYAIHTGILMLHVDPRVEFAEKDGVRLSLTPLAVLEDASGLYLQHAQDATL